MDFDFDTGTIYGGLQTLNVATLPPLGGQAGVLTVVGTGALTLPGGTDLQQPVTPAAGMFRFNSDTTLLEYYNGTVWSPLATAAGSVSSVAANSNSSGLTITGSPITSAGTFQFTLDAGLQALSVKSSTGLMVQTGADTYGTATITGTAGNITVSNGDGVAGNPTLNLATAGTPVTAQFVKITTDTFGRVSATTPVVQSDITTLVDSVYVNVSGDSMDSGANLTFVGGGEVLGLPSTPSAASAAASKAYVDSVSQGLSWKQAARVATTSDVPGFVAGVITVPNNDPTYFPTVSGPIEIDGIALANGDRVVIKSQTATEGNGIYVVTDAGVEGTTDAVLTRAPDMDTGPEFDGSAVFVQEGATLESTAWVETATVVVVNTDPVVFVQFSGTNTYVGGTGITVAGNIISLQTPVTVPNGGTGLSTAPTNGQLLIGNGTNYTLSTLTAGTGVSVTNGAGSITVANTGVLSITGTANQITASASTGAVTLSTPAVFIAPGSVTATTTLAISGNTADSFLYSGLAGLVATTAAPLDGELLIGSTGATPVKSTLTAGSGVTITNGAGSITIAADPTAVVTTFSAGTTGFTPNSATSGAITLAGTLATTNGGTGLTTIGTANQFLSVNTGATGLEYKSISAGTGISVTPGAGVLTIANTGVTSVALALPASVFSVSGSPVTTTGTLTGSFATQTANTVFAGPTTGAAAAPTFRGLVFDDISGAIQLYAENPSTPTAPSAVGSNAVAIGSGATATADGSLAQGDGSNATVWGGRAFANGSFATAGDAQTGLYVLRNETTTNTTTALFLDGTTGTQRLVVGNNSVWTFDILVTARRTDATGGGAGYRFVGVIRKDATSGSTTFVGTPSKTVIGETNASWDAVVSANTTDGDLRITVTGENAKTIRWVAVVTTAEVTN